MKTVGIDLTFIKSIDGETSEEVFALGLLRGLYNAGKQMNMIIFALDSVKKQLISAYPGLHVIGIRRSDKRFYSKAIKKHQRKTPFDVIYYPHAHIDMNMSLKCETVVTVHGLRSKKASKKKIGGILRKLGKASHVVAASEFVRDELLSKSRAIKDSKLTVIHNPAADIRPGVDIVLKKKFILSVNSDSAQKNLIAIVKAFNRIKDEVPHDLVIIGNIDENGRAYRYIKKYGLKSRVIVTGRINRDILFGYYRNTDLFINASRYMGFGYTPIEALACGAKVLSTRTPSVDAIPDVECDGYIVNPHKYEEIANKILITLFQPHPREMLESRAAKVRDFYSPVHAAEQYAEVFGI